MPNPIDVEYGTTLAAITCGSCHIPFAIPEGMLTARRIDGHDFWCPNGHAIHYFETENQKLRKKLEHLESDKKWLERARDTARANADHERARANGYKGALTKTKKRIGRGVCPCCNRHFANVEGHMRSQHPEFVDGQAGDAGG